MVRSSMERCQPVLSFSGTIAPSWRTLLLIALLTGDLPAAPTGAVWLCRRNYSALQAPVPWDRQRPLSLMDAPRTGEG